MQAIKIAPEYHWLESGYSQDLKITGNTVINSGREALLIQPIGSGTGFSDIYLQDNDFQTDYIPAVSYPAEGVYTQNEKRAEGRFFTRFKRPF
jgi:hypothetical protein